jgi:simple sugar transport system ATP-binding protein
MSMTENMAIKYYWRPPAASGKFFIDWSYLSRFAEELAKIYGVQIVSPGAPISAMSGGNLQKLMLARELSGKPKVILAMHPVWGLDVGAAEFVRERLLAERARGAGIILVSEDLDELMEMSDRIMVMSKGRIMGMIENPAVVSKEEIGLMMGGTKMEGAA